MFGNRAYNPYQVYPVARRSIDWGNLLNNTQKTLNIINQTIPIVYQLKPIVSNAKTMFRIFDAVKSDGSRQETTRYSTNGSNYQETQTTGTTQNQPNFFL